MTKLEELARFIEGVAEENRAGQKAAERGSSKAWFYHGGRMTAGIILEKLEEMQGGDG